MWTSVPHNEVAVTFTTASCGPGVGSAQSVRVSPGPAVALTSACMHLFYTTQSIDTRLSVKESGCTDFPAIGRIPAQTASVIKRGHELFYGPVRKNRKVQG